MIDKNTPLKIANFALFEELYFFYQKLAAHRLKQKKVKTLIINKSTRKAEFPAPDVVITAETVEAVSAGSVSSGFCVGAVVVGYVLL